MLFDLSRATWQLIIGAFGEAWGPELGGRKWLPSWDAGRVRLSSIKYALWQMGASGMKVRSLPKSSTPACGTQALSCRAHLPCMAGASHMDTAGGDDRVTGDNMGAQGTRDQEHFPHAAARCDVRPRQSLPRAWGDGGRCTLRRRCHGLE